jgi:hypothetical protein
MQFRQEFPLPVLSAWDPRAAVSGSIDPLGALRPFTAIATTLFPGITTITTRVRYLSWVCAGLRILNGTPNAPTGGRSGRARRQRVLAWERLLALATGMYATSVGAAADDDAWRQLRGVTYVLRAIAEGLRGPAFPMLRNQAGIGGVGTYWVTLVAGGLVEEDSGALTTRGEALADAFLKFQVTPERGKLHRLLAGGDVTFSELALTEWGCVAHLGAASKGEQSLLADALLEPLAHRRMAAAMQAVSATNSDADTFSRLSKQLRTFRDPLSEQLAAVLTVTQAFEALHAELLYRFNLIRAINQHGRPIAASAIDLTGGKKSLPKLGETLVSVLEQHTMNLPASVTEAVRGFWLAVEPTVRARSNGELVFALVRYHERVQSGKLDASRQPKLPWMESRGSDIVVAPRYSLVDPPRLPVVGIFTHPYRIEQFSGMFAETGDRTASA